MRKCHVSQHALSEKHICHALKAAQNSSIPAASLASASKPIATSSSSQHEDTTIPSPQFEDAPSGSPLLNSSNPQPESTMERDASTPPAIAAVSDFEMEHILEALNNLADDSLEEETQAPLCEQ
ncbi:hypothetical protein AcV5_009900 [Taiwanofungus camphoratus]|nr:hypothetical protein AcV5_009900 [Antrodia cinnamomea]